MRSTDKLLFAIKVNRRFYGKIYFYISVQDKSMNKYFNDNYTLITSTKQEVRSVSGPAIMGDIYFIQGFGQSNDKELKLNKKEFDIYLATMRIAINKMTGNNNTDILLIGDTYEFYG